MKPFRNAQYGLAIVADDDSLLFMTCRPFAVSVGISLLVLGACDKPSTQPQGRDKEPSVAVAGAVGFAIEPLKDNGSSMQWLATYTAQGKTARFRIELGRPTTSMAEPPDFAIKSGDGRFVAESGSDATALLADLKKVLEAKTQPTKVQRVRYLPFTFVAFGPNYSQAPGGGFSATPAGHWTPMKIFLGQGDQEGQVFLNLNPLMKEGQFSIKDSEYGDIVLAQLARVL